MLPSIQNVCARELATTWARAAGEQVRNKIFAPLVLGRGGLGAEGADGLGFGIVDAKNS